MDPEISVIIPCRGHPRELEDCLRMLERRARDRLGSLDYEVIVVDSAADPAVAEVASRFSCVRLVRAESPTGPGEARNLGGRHARGAYLAFTDADCVPEPGWLLSAHSGLRGGAALVGGPVLDVRPLHPIAAADNLLQFADFGPRRPEGPVPYLPGANIAVDRTVFDGLGGFPPVAVGEDTLFSGAASERWPERVLFLRDMRVRHAGRTGWGEFWRHQESFGYARGWLGLRMRPIERRWAGSLAMVVPIMLKRMTYILIRTAQWRPAVLPRSLLFLPVLAAGALAWSVGCRRGCRHAAAASAEGVASRNVIAGEAVPEAEHRDGDLKKAAVEARELG